MTNAMLDEEAPPARPPYVIPGVVELQGPALKLQRRLVLLVTVVPLLGVAFAAWTLWGRGLSLLDAALFLLTYVFTGLGVTVGFHRLFTHRSFKTTPALRALLAVAGSMAIQGPIIKWVADHRRHHAFADQPGDPHSPHLDEGPGLRGVLKGLWHAHMGWFWDEEVTELKRWAPDLMKESPIRRIDSLFPLWATLSFVGPGIIGLVVTRSWSGALTAFVWGGLVRIFLLHHVTWSVNSICHFYGKRPHDTTDHSTNNWPLALISFGESWHNNHHAFPVSAVHGIGRRQVDLTAGVIRALEKAGVVWDVRTVTEKQLEAVRPAVE
ncbi:MAG: acyl-CoA desaturase [Actinomycetota bacterium]|nr:acyl-CoA desaturase [Actinomycetota bacterium]